MNDPFGWAVNTAQPIFGRTGGPGGTSPVIFYKVYRSRSGHCKFSPGKTPPAAKKANKENRYIVKIG